MHGCYDVLRSFFFRANRAKLLRLEKDHRDLQHNYDLYKQRTERVASEMEKTNQKLNTQIHNDRKEIVRLKEVGVVSGRAPKHCFVQFIINFPF